MNLQAGGCGEDTNLTFWCCWVYSAFSFSCAPVAHWVAFGRGSSHCTCCVSCPLLHRFVGQSWHRTALILDSERFFEPHNFCHVTTGLSRPHTTVCHALTNGLSRPHTTGCHTLTNGLSRPHTTVCHALTNGLSRPHTTVCHSLTNGLSRPHTIVCHALTNGLSRPHTTVCHTLTNGLSSPHTIVCHSLTNGLSRPHTIVCHASGSPWPEPKTEKHQRMCFGAAGSLALAPSPTSCISVCSSVSLDDIAAEGGLSFPVEPRATVWLAYP